MRKNILLLGLIGVVFSLSSCSIFGNKEYNYTVTKISGTDFYKRTTDYELEGGEGKYKKLTCYYKNNEEICYVDVLSMFNMFKDNLSSDPNVFTNSLNNGVVTISFKGQKNDQSIVLDSSTNEVTVSGTNFYAFYFEGEGKSSADEYETFDYAYSDKAIEFNLKDYNLTSYYIDNTVLLPLSIFQLVYTQLIGYNYYYVNGKIHGSFTGGYNYSGSSLKNATEEIKELNYNYLRLFLNKFYGLSKYKGYNDLTNVDTLLNKYKTSLYSNSKRENETAVKKILDYELDDLHTGVINNSIYHGNYDVEVGYSPKYQNLSDSLKSLEKQYKQSDFGSMALYDKTTNQIFGQIYQDTVYLKLDEFNYTSKSSKIDPSKINDDTFTFMYLALNQLKSYSYIKNVVIDLTQNTGGAVISGLELLSFMTNDKIVWSYESLNGEYGYEEAIVDNDFDGDLTDDDAFTNYNYYIEISDVSFSCANLVPFIAKEYNYATIIGTTSAGGMGVVDYGVLPDGTYFQYSSATKLNCHKDQKSGRSCEDGVLPDIAIDSKQLYNYAYIATKINK